tara:strand:+ start:606 stop:839 length:234 start_codon:yes stop_codon:yes gene_type:complete
MQEIAKLKLMYNDVFTSDAGAKVLQDLEARCNWRTSSYVAGDANATAFEEGKRAVLLHIFNMMEEETNVRSRTGSPV